MNGSVFVVISHFLSFSTGDHRTMEIVNIFVLVCAHCHCFPHQALDVLFMYSQTKSISSTSSQLIQYVDSSLSQSSPPGVWCAPYAVSTITNNHEIIAIYSLSLILTILFTRRLVCSLCGLGVCRSCSSLHSGWRRQKYQIQT